MVIVELNPQDPRPSGPDVISRRTALGLGGAALGLSGAAIAAASFPPDAGALARPQQPPTAAAAQNVIDVLRPEIQPRDAWGLDLPVTGDIVAEDDVRFLLVHHTASTNDYGQDQVVDQIRDFYRFHTGPEKGWPDVAYNFFVDRFGGIWEARAGSIDGPVRGDATGGSQGFALLCSLIGNHTEAEVTPEALESLSSLLAWLAERHGIDTTPGTLVDFTSRGSNRWPEGAAVTTPTISGHRDMSQTTCPGDATYQLLATDIPTRVSARRQAAMTAVASSTTTTSVGESSTESSTAQASQTESAQAESAQLSTEPAGAAGAQAESDEVALGGDGDGSGVTAFTVFVGAAATFGAVLLAGAAKFRRRTAS